MRYKLIAALVLISNVLCSQTEGTRMEWRTSHKIKVDVINLMDEFASVLIGWEYPLKDASYALEHEIGPILNSSWQHNEISKTSGFKTSHTLLLNVDNSNWVFGIGGHFRQLNVQGRVTACAQDGAPEIDGCSYFLLYDEPIQTQRWAGYFRIRRDVNLKRRVSLNFGVDIGRFKQSITNDDFKSEGLSLRTQWMRQNLNNGTGFYFRLHTQFKYRL